jgi:uncharacterized protein (TIGR00369 family)
MIETVLDRFFQLSPWAKLFGWHLIDARPDDGWIRVGFDGKREFCNSAGIVQGGMLSAMLDGTMGAAVIVMTHGKFYDPTISMTVHFIARAKTGPMTCEARVTRLGKSIAFVEGRLTADDGALLATASASTRLVESAKAVTG